MKTICLAMIVKNEAHLILDTLHHLSNYITFDYWVVNDNGSTDGTQQFIVEYFKEKGIPGELDETPWKDFGYNRTIVFQRAYQKTDYVFVWDADDEIHGTFNIPDNLSSDSYQCTFGNEAGLRYSRKQLFSNRLQWEYRGVLHEYPVCIEKTNSSSTIHGAYYFISGRKGNRNKDPKKYEKDALLLEKAFQEETEDGIKNRYAFYAAQSYNSANIHEKAIEWYKKVLTLSGWLEEKYISCITIYDLYEKQNKHEDGLHYLVESFIYNKIRIEGVYRLIKYYCIKKQYDIAYAYYTWIQEAYENKYKEEQHGNQLFVKKDEYDFYLPYYMIIVSERLKKMGTFSKMYEIIFSKKYLHTTAWWIHNLFNNIQFGITFLPKNLSFLESMFTYIMQLQNKNIALKAEQYRMIDNIITQYRPLLTAPIHHPISLHKKNKINVMFTMTTCKRYDLFQQTIHSIKRNWKDVDQIDYFFCVDDNSSMEDRANMQLHYPFFDYYMKTPEERGHRESMNIIWNKLKTVQPTYWIHMEDDWVFIKEEQYVTKSIHWLEKYENQHIHQLVFNREYGLMMEDMQRVGGRLLESGLWLHEQKPVQGRNCAYWPHYSLQPSMVRTSIILELGDYTSPNTLFERDYANKYAAKGYQTMFFNFIYSIHIGKQHWEMDGKNAYALNNVQQLNTKSTPTILTTYRKYVDAFFLFLESDLAPSSTYPIHVGREPSSSVPYILYNTEQLSRSINLDRILLEIKKTSPKEIWDYSKINCSILKMHGIDAKHIPIQIPKNYIDICKKWHTEIKYDIGFCGQLSDRRMHILHTLKEKGYSVNCITLFGEERDKELAACRIHLNIHCEEDYQLFESARCELWLQVGVPIISENSLDNDSRCINIPYENMVETTIQLIQDMQSNLKKDNI